MHLTQVFLHPKIRPRKAKCKSRKRTKNSKVKSVFRDLESIAEGRKRKVEGEQLAVTHTEFSPPEFHNGMRKPKCERIKYNK